MHYLNKKNAVISIAAGYSQEDLIKKIKNRGYAVIGVDKNPNAMGFKFCDECVVASTHNSEPIIKELEKLKNRWNFAGIIVQSSGLPAITAGEIARHFNLKFISPDIARIVINKDKLIPELNKNGVSAPKVKVISRREDVNVDFPPPYFVKPSQSFLTHTGMGMIEDRSNLSLAVEDAIKASENGKVNVEQFVSGVDVLSIDWVWKNKKIHVATLEEISSGPPHFYGLGWKMPVSSVFEKVAKDIQKQFTESFGIDNSIVETGMKIYQDKAYIYEASLDLGGDGVPDVLLPASLGYDLFEDGISVALGEAPLGPKKNVTPSYLRFLLQSEMKKNTEKMFEEIKNKFGGKKADFKELPAKMNNEFRATAVLLTSDTVEELDLKINDFEKWLKIK